MTSLRPGEPLLQLDDTLRDLLAVAWEVRHAHFPPELEAVYPTKTAAVSVTGTTCALQCAHCRGHYLKGMTPLAEFLGREPRGKTSLLLSGGCDREGRVPLLPHLATLTELGQRYRLNLHTGLLTPAEAAAIGPLAHLISFDLVGDETTIREIYGLNRSVEDYRRLYQELRRYARRVVPHLTLGLHGGEFRGEYRVLEMLQEEGAKALVLLVFIPTRGTPLATASPPPLGEVARFLAEARRRLPTTQLYLGCMRPGGRYREWLDMLAVRAGLNRIVMPARVALSLAEALGLTVTGGDECCAFE